MNDWRESGLLDPHVRPLTELILSWRARGLDVPNIDPDDGGVLARALFLLESPGPRAVGTGFISRDNPDPSARNMTAALAGAGFDRVDTVLWNVVPYCISTREQNRNASSADIRAAAPFTQAFIDLLPKLKVIVFCGRRAQRAEQYLSISVPTLRTFHPGAMAYSHQRLRKHLQRTFAEAHDLLYPQRLGHPVEVIGFASGYPI
jgi:uracil-DNA glycosylase